MTLLVALALQESPAQAYHGHGGSGWGWGIGAGLATGAIIGAAATAGRPSLGAPDYKGRDYWRIDNEAPFPITVKTDFPPNPSCPGYTIYPGDRMVKAYRMYDFGFIVSGGGKQNKLGSMYHNLAIGIDQFGNLQILNQWNQ